MGSKEPSLYFHNWAQKLKLFACILWVSRSPKLENLLHNHSIAPPQTCLHPVYPIFYTHTLNSSASGPGLAAAAKAYLGKALDKSQQCSDWDARPLSEAQRAYAALDAVAVLLIHEKLRSVDDAIEKLRRIPPR